MTTKEFISLEKELSAKLPGFVVEKRLMFIPPTKSLLKAIHFDGSSFDKKSFYVNVFALPLCIPTKYLYFNFGHRVRHNGNGGRWDNQAPNLIEELTGSLKAQAIPFLSSINSLEDFAKVAETFSFQNPHTHKAIAFALARCGDDRQAIRVINRLLPTLDLKVPWQAEIGDMTKALKADLEESPTKAQKLLDNWEMETRKNLGLGD